MESQGMTNLSTSKIPIKLSLAYTAPMTYKLLAVKGVSDFNNFLIQIINFRLTG